MTSCVFLLLLLLLDRRGCYYGRHDSGVHSADGSGRPSHTSSMGPWGHVYFQYFHHHLVASYGEVSMATTIVGDK